MCLAPAKEIPSFEEAVHDTLAAWSTEGPATEDEDEERNEGLLMAALEETAYQKWLDFFEVLTPRQHPLVLDGTSLEWRVLQALEGNLVMARDQQRRRSRRATAGAGARAAMDNVSRISLSDWSEMIQRLRLRVEVLPTVPAPTNPFTTTGGRFPLLPPQRDNDDRLRPPYSSPEGGNGNNNGGQQQQEDSDNQRALDRVTYLGGILLPISIVSGVLSMNEDFEPGSPLFWVFWVAALPLTGLSVVLIYADKLRRAEVWVQVVEQEQEQEQEEGPEVVDGKGEEGSSSLGEGGLINWGEKEEEKVKFRRGRNKRKKAKQGKQTRYDGGYMTGLERIHPPQPVDSKTDENTPEAQSPPANFPDAVTYGGLVEGDDIVIDLSGAIQQGQEPQTISVEPPPPPPPPPPAASPSPPPESEASEAEEEDEEDEDEESSEDEDEDEEIDEDDRRHHVKPITWRRKELGWGGAAMCILKMQKPPNMRPS